MVRLCSREGCEEKHFGLGLCQKHYNADRYAATSDITKERTAAYRSEHPEQNRASSATWSKAHPENHRATEQRRRAAKRASIIERFLDTEIFERDDYICQICFEPIDPFLRWPNVLSASLDHIIPIIKGGDHTRDNVQASHLSCNASKGAR